jgi:uncharacterized protein
MTILIEPNTGCNLGCTYCYEEPDRQHSQAEIDAEYDIEKMMDRLDEFSEKYPEVPTLFGGEPLLMRNEHIERIFKWIYEEYDLEETGRYSGIQTNGTLIKDAHIEMFEKYRVQVGISCDGPSGLNDLRLARTEMGGEMRDVTETMTDRTLNSIDRLKKTDVPVNIITVLTKQNAGTDEKLEQLLDWMSDLTKHGVNGHFQPAIPIEGVQENQSMSPERIKEVYLQSWEWYKAEPYHQWGPMTHYVDNLLGNHLAYCVNAKCDPFNPAGAKVIQGDGGTSGCGKTWSGVGDGQSFLQGDSTGNEYNNTEERYEMLKQVPGPYTEGEEDQGGCKGCRYWNLCTGGCPADGIDHDYRNRTRNCKAKYALYEKIEEDLRAMLPGIRLVTDAPWDAPLADMTVSREVDIKPFAGMHHSQAENPSVSGGFHNEPNIESIANEESAGD